MSSLSNIQKQLVFDYCLGLTSENETTLAKGLISSAEDAVKIHKGLQAILEPLKALRPRNCPDYLVLHTLHLVRSPKKWSSNDKV